MNNINKMMNIRTGLLLTLISTVVIAGCTNKNDNHQPVRDNDQSTRSSQERGSFLLQGEQGSVEDLIIGEQIVVFGTSSADGSLTAEVIRIGTLPEGDFRRFAQTSNNDFTGDHEPTGETRRGNLPEGFDPEEFQNLSQEERQARFAEFREHNDGNESDFRGGFRGGGGSPQRREGSETVRGEILDIDETIITLKIEEGGSRLVFYTDETQIRKEGEVEDEQGE